MITIALPESDKCLQTTQNGVQCCSDDKLHPCYEMNCTQDKECCEILSGWLSGS